MWYSKASYILPLLSGKRYPLVDFFSVVHLTNAIFNDLTGRKSRYHPRSEPVTLHLCEGICRIRHVEGKGKPSSLDTILKAITLSRGEGTFSEKPCEILVGRRAESLWAVEYTKSLRSNIVLYSFAFVHICSNNNFSFLPSGSSSGRLSRGSAYASGSISLASTVIEINTSGAKNKLIRRTVEFSWFRVGPWCRKCLGSMSPTIPKYVALKTRYGFACLWTETFITNDNGKKHNTTFHKTIYSQDYPLNNKSWSNFPVHLAY